MNHNRKTKILIPFTHSYKHSVHFLRSLHIHVEVPSLSTLGKLFVDFVLKLEDGLKHHTCICTVLYHHSVCLVIFFLISPDGSPSRQGISETEFMERIRERMAQEVGGYVS